jgi:D-glycero-alpha-D-manno-heptose-7-phosphate kinase
MIITRSPLRVSLIGGGSDVESHFSVHGGSVVSFAINKYVYTSIHKRFLNGIRFAYSETEIVSHYSKLKHNIARESLKYFSLSENLEITTIADVPSKGTGLSSSSAFTASLLLGLSKLSLRTFSKSDFAELVCRIEIQEVGSPIGKQDQYATVFGDLNNIIFHKDGRVEVVSDLFDHHQRFLLENHILLVHTGIDRKTEDVIFNTGDNNHLNRTRILNQISGLTTTVIKAIRNQQMEELGEVISYSWDLKKSLKQGISNTVVDNLLAKGIRAGAYGGKLLGAGKGGFILFICPPEKKNSVLDRLNLKNLDIKIAKNGTELIYEN